MEQPRTFKIDNYITVPGFAIVELGLSGNELLCYSLIYGFTQDKETEFRGSLNYVASALNVTKQNAKKIIDRLIDRGLVDKREMYFSGVKFCHYVANRYGVAETATGHYQNNNGGVAETATNIDNNKDNSNDRIEDNADGGLFPSESTTPVIVKQSRRKPKCLFEDTEFADFEKFKEKFVEPEFADIDLLYYYNRIKNWSGANGKKKNDWILTAKNWMMDDAEKGKLHRLSSGSALSPEAIEYLQNMAD